ncbi:hypothetical protein L1D24_20870 [Vibrio brasiliensis]|uniref:hypothetical protein n=1 Tax=Vibrio brasiliensis TaxID=170652 RepID=UPI001EFE9E36|nr:hypothetical protein [Vibrio brasiliensis]MCG9650990.1 hypothetical protein [Vibrio brasiliensis]
MEIDYDYLGEILNVFVAANKPYVTLKELDDKAPDVLEYENYAPYLSDRFTFHLHVMVGEGLIESLMKGPYQSLGDTGAMYEYQKVRASIGDLDNERLALSKEGRQLAKVLAQPKLVQKIKENLKEAPLKTVVDISLKVFEHALKKKVEDAMQS